LPLTNELVCWLGYNVRNLEKPYTFSGMLYNPSLVRHPLLSYCLRSTVYCQLALLWQSTHISWHVRLSLRLDGKLKREKQSKLLRKWARTQGNATRNIERRNLWIFLCPRPQDSTCIVNPPTINTPN